MKSDTIGELGAALLKAQNDFPSIKRGRNAEIETKSGGSYTYSYADLGDIRDAILPVLAANGLVVTQCPSAIGESPALTTTLIHTSGEWISDTMPLGVKDAGAQALGSAITYARRYALSAIVGVVTESDDDGAAASRQSHKGYDGGNPDFDLIIRAAEIEGGQFLTSLASQIQSKGTLTEKQLATGLRAATNIIEADSEPPY